MAVINSTIAIINIKWGYIKQSNPKVESITLMKNKIHLYVDPRDTLDSRVQMG